MQEGESERERDQEGERVVEKRGRIREKKTKGERE